MSRGGSYGGGKSSLGYLFGTDHEEQSAAQPTRPASQALNSLPVPPYGVDHDHDHHQQKPNPDHHQASATHQSPITGSNNYHRPQGQNTGNFITDRPSTKVKSVPGGDSSLGFLFGDK